MHPVALLLLVLFAESLGIGFAIRIEEFLASLLPRRFEFERCDIPVRPAFLGNGTQVLAEIFHRGSTEVPVAVVDLVNDKAGLEDDHVRDHRIVDRVGVFGDVEIFLDDAPHVGKERPVGTNAAVIFIGLRDIVGANRDEPAIGNFELAMELTSPSACRRSFGQKPPRLRTRTIGCCLCNSESFRRFPVWSESS